MSLTIDIQIIWSQKFPYEPMYFITFWKCSPTKNNPFHKQLHFQVTELIFYPFNLFFNNYFCSRWLIPYIIQLFIVNDCEWYCFCCIALRHPWTKQKRFLCMSMYLLASTLKPVTWFVSDGLFWVHLLNLEKHLLNSSCLSYWFVQPSVCLTCIILAPAGWILLKVDIGDFCWKLLRKSRCG